MEPGDRYIVSTRLYGGSITQFGKAFKRFDWQADFVDVDDIEAVRRAVTATTKAVFVDSLANPGGVVSDIEALARLAHEAGIPLDVDNTLPTPCPCRPSGWVAAAVVTPHTNFLPCNGAGPGA